MRQTLVGHASARVRLILLAAGIMAGGAFALAAEAGHKTKPFSGAKVNGGMVMHSKSGDKNVLTLSEDFKVPDTPAPHWQVVDSKGNVYLLQRLMIKGDKLNKTVTVPTYVSDIAKVQIWCAWAEVLLGEAPFDSPVR